MVTYNIFLIENSSSMIHFHINLKQSDWFVANIFLWKYRLKFWWFQSIRPLLKITFVLLIRSTYLHNYQYINKERILQFFSLKSLQDPIFRRHILFIQASLRHSFFIMFQVSVKMDGFKNECRYWYHIGKPYNFLLSWKILIYISNTF